MIRASKNSPPRRHPSKSHGCPSSRQTDRNSRSRHVFSLSDIVAVFEALDRINRATAQPSMTLTQIVRTTHRFQKAECGPTRLMRKIAYRATGWYARYFTGVRSTCSLRLQPNSNPALLRLSAMSFPISRTAAAKRMSAASSAAVSGGVSTKLMSENEVSGLRLRLRPRSGFPFLRGLAPHWGTVPDTIFRCARETRRRGRGRDA